MAKTNIHDGLQDGDSICVVPTTIIEDALGCDLQNPQPYTKMPFLRASRGTVDAVTWEELTGMPIEK